MKMNIKIKENKVDLFENNRLCIEYNNQELGEVYLLWNFRKLEGLVIFLDSVLIDNLDKTERKTIFSELFKDILNIFEKNFNMLITKINYKVVIWHGDSCRMFKEGVLEVKLELRNIDF